MLQAYKYNKPSIALFPVNEAILNMSVETKSCCRQITGDEVLSVNGTAFQDFTHQEALDTFKVTVKML